MGRILVIVSACALLVGSGVVHGLWTDRWSDQSDLADAAGRLQQLPLTLGSWHGGEIGMETNAPSSQPGMIARRYVHSKTGQGVTILFACGRAGPICTHTPDVCYSGNGYEVEQPRRFQLTSTSAQTPPEFWTARFIKECTSGKSHLRIFWSWYDAEAWKIADNPRLNFAGVKVLHKIYLIHEMTQPDEPLETDPCVEFMREILPTLERTVFAKANSPAAN